MPVSKLTRKLSGILLGSDDKPRPNSAFTITTIRIFGAGGETVIPIDKTYKTDAVGAYDIDLPVLSSGTVKYRFRFEPKKATEELNIADGPDTSIDEQINLNQIEVENAETYLDDNAVLYSKAQSLTGPQQAQGRANLGVTGGASYEHTQGSPSNQWIINHNLGFFPVVEARTVGGYVMEAEVFHQSINTAIVNLAGAYAGSARCA